MITFKIAFRNVFRRKKRTILTVLAIAFGYWLAIIFHSIGNHSYNSMIDNSAAMGYGHVAIMPPDYINKPSSSKFIGQIDRLQPLMRHPAVDYYVPRIMINATISTASRSVPSQIMGLDIEAENIPKNLYLSSIVEGEIFGPSETRKIILGKDLARKIRARIGQKIVYTSTTVDGDIVSELARVAAIFETGTGEFDGYSAVVPLRDLQDSLKYGDRGATFVAMILKEHRQSIAVRQKIQTQLKKMNISADVLTWPEATPDLAGFVAIDRGGSQVFILLVLMLVGVGVFNTMLMSVIEKTREFGVILAIGLRPRQLIAGVMLETLMITVSGLGVGAVLISGMHYYLNEMGIDLASFYEGQMTAGGAVMDSRLGSFIFWDQVWWITCGIIMLCLIAAIIPARKASKVQPAQVMRMI
jgi:ABC-type lipoprotein release transport system permease subunit